MSKGGSSLRYVRTRAGAMKGGPTHAEPGASERAGQRDAARNERVHAFRRATHERAQAKLFQRGTGS